MNSKNVVAVLQRDVAYFGRAVVAVVFIGFASIAIGAAVVDLLPN